MHGFEWWKDGDEWRWEDGLGLKLIRGLVLVNASIWKLKSFDGKMKKDEFQHIFFFFSSFPSSLSLFYYLGNEGLININEFFIELINSMIFKLIILNLRRLWISCEKVSIYEPNFLYFCELPNSPYKPFYVLLRMAISRHLISFTS